jgi:hypothetical protein
VLIANPQCATFWDLRSRSEHLSALDDEALAAAVDEVEWLELVEVLNREREPAAWRLRAVMRRE